MFSYTPLWKTLKEKKVSTYRLIQMGFDSHTLSNLKQGKGVTVATLEKLCTMLDCKVEDVIEISPDQ